jgi:predicted DCC family thiol-disulfide oxidoreductase YuxK
MRDAFSYRTDPAVPAFPDDHPILIFDGKCLLCSGFVQIILYADRNSTFRFLAAQSPLGAASYQHYDLVAGDYESNILLQDGKVWLKSDGSIRIFEQLGLPWSLVALARVLPRSLRDRIYDRIARNRLKWFGARDACYLPDASETDRFIG